MDVGEGFTPVDWVEDVLVKLRKVSKINFVFFRY